MNWLAMSPFEVAALWSVAAALAVWLYLHNRRSFRRRVSTLRFWTSVHPISQGQRRRLREPWALLAQVLFLLLVILALADLRMGATFEGRRVVIVLDTSIWSQAQAAGESPWIDQARDEAGRVLDALPPYDQVLLTSAEANARLIMPFTTDRAALRRAIAEARSSSSVADVPRALEMGRAALIGSRRGLLVYIGPGMLDQQQAQKLDEFRRSMGTAEGSGDHFHFLVRLVGGAAAVENRGITRLSVRRDPAQPDRWHLLAQVKNYSESRASVVLKLSIDGQSLGQQAISLAANELANVEGEFVWEQGGVLRAEIDLPDALSADNRAHINLPSFRRVRVALIVTDSPLANELFTVLSSNPYLQVELVGPGTTVDGTPDVAIYQSASLPTQLAFNSIWFVQGDRAAGSSFLRATGWNSQHPVTRWIRTHDVSVRNPTRLPVLPTDTVLASIEGNPPVPLIVAREQNGHRVVIIGFDPDDSNFPLQSAFPLLMAGSIEWMTHSVEEVVDSFSVGELNLPGPATRIIAPSGREVPFARNGPDVHLLATETGTYRVIAPNGEKSISVNAPLLPTDRLQAIPAETAPIGPEPPRETGWNLWRVLIALAIVALWLEWRLYYSSRRKTKLTESGEAPGDTKLRSFDSGSERNRAESDTRDPEFVTQADT